MRCVDIGEESEADHKYWGEWVKTGVKFDDNCGLQVKKVLVSYKSVDELERYEG
jgi:hypothetical protein